jgi:hypothetical protein
VDFSKARDLFGIVSQFSGPNCKNSGPRVNYKETQGFFAKMPGITEFQLF